MSNPTVKDKQDRQAHTRRLEHAKFVLEHHGYNVELQAGDTFDRLIVDRIFAGARPEKVSLEHVRQCLSVNGLGLMYVERYSNLMASVDDVRNPILGFNKAIIKDIKKKGGSNGNPSRTGKSKNKK